MILQEVQKTGFPCGYCCGMLGFWDMATLKGFLHIMLKHGVELGIDSKI